MSCAGRTTRVPKVGLMEVSFVADPGLANPTLALPHPRIPLIIMTRNSA